MKTTCLTSICFKILHISPHTFRCHFLLSFLFFSNGLKSSKYSATDIGVPLGKAFRNLVFGEDQKLTDAYAQFHKMVEQEQGVVRNMTLAGVEQIHQKTSVIQIDVKAALAITERTDGNTKTLIASTDQAHRYLEGKILSGDWS